MCGARRPQVRPFGGLRPLARFVLEAEPGAQVRRQALWRAAIHWGYEHGAAYQILQTQVHGASDRLCAAEGLVSLGVVHQTDALACGP